jgi:two-component system, OmpR family, KDP operon response regulator KdpE
MTEVINVRDNLVVQHPDLRILVVDDETAIRRFLHISLTACQYTILEAASAQAAIELLVAQRPDLLILDLGLPDLDGIEVTKLLRTWTAIPIIILSVRGQEADKIAALDAGADDYLVKPFAVGELLARIRVALRRSNRTNAEPIFTAGELRVDLVRRLVTMGTCEVQLTPNEYDLLHLLVNHAGKVLTHPQLLRAIWGAGYEKELHMLRVNISNLRRKLEPEPTRPRYLITEPGVGYRLRTEV